MLTTEKIINTVKRHEQQLISERRMLHINAEPSCMEYQTAEYVLQEMSALGLSPVWVRDPVWMASESFGKYQKIVPGLFAFVGIRNEALGSGAGHHNAKFDMDERALSLGACATL